MSKREPDEHTLSLLTFENGKLVDYGHAGWKWRKLNSPVITAENHKFDLYSYYGDGSLRDYRTTIHGSPIMNGDFTAEAWVYFTSIGGHDTIFNLFRSDVGLANGLHLGAEGVLVGNNDGIGWSFTLGNLNMVTNQWIHYAVVRLGNTITAYRNGVAVSSGTYTDTVGRANLDYDFVIGGISKDWHGNYDSGYCIHGYIDEFRLSDVARYTSNFAPQQKSFLG